MVNVTELCSLIEILRQLSSAVLTVSEDAPIFLQGDERQHLPPSSGTCASPTIPHSSPLMVQLQLTHVVASCPSSGETRGSAPQLGPVTSPPADGATACGTTRAEGLNSPGFPSPEGRPGVSLEPPDAASVVLGASYDGVSLIIESAGENLIRVAPMTVCTRLNRVPHSARLVG
jgi:hypothetical protein